MHAGQAAGHVVAEFEDLIQAGYQEDTPYFRLDGTQPELAQGSGVHQLAESQQLGDVGGVEKGDLGEVQDYVAALPLLDEFLEGVEIVGKLGIVLEISQDDAVRPILEGLVAFGPLARPRFL